MKIVRDIARGVLAPNAPSVTPQARFDLPKDAASQALGRIPRAVVSGFEHGLMAQDADDLQHRLALLESDLVSFGYEGAAMASTVLDAMTNRKATRTTALLTGPGHGHLFLSYIGIGFALARLPRPLWRFALPSLPADEYHPVMSWLAIDGYGFDLAYFNPDRYVVRQERPAPYPWLGAHSAYGLRAVDQGIGRALWFIGGGRTASVRRLVEAFAADRRADLWSGVGLAAAVAGWGDDLEGLVDAAGSHRADLSTGAVFGTKGRISAGPLPEHHEPALKVLAGIDASTAVALIDATAPARRPNPGPVPAYELWRSGVRRAVA